MHFSCVNKPFACFYKVLIKTAHIHIHALLKELCIGYLVQYTHEKCSPDVIKIIFKILQTAGSRSISLKYTMDMRSEKCPKHI